MKYYIDARFLGEPERAHAYLREKLSLPEYYGNNLDALYDCLTELPEADIILQNADLLEDPEERRIYERFLQVLCDACQVTVMESMEE